MLKTGKRNYLTVPAAIRELEKIELIRQTDRGYTNSKRTLEEVIDFLTSTEEEPSAMALAEAN